MLTIIVLALIILSVSQIFYTFFIVKRSLNNYFKPKHANDIEVDIQIEVEQSCVHEWQFHERQVETNILINYCSPERFLFLHQSNLRPEDLHVTQYYRRCGICQEEELLDTVQTDAENHLFQREIIDVLDEVAYKPVDE